MRQLTIDHSTRVSLVLLPAIIDFWWGTLFSSLHIPVLMMAASHAAEKKWANKMRLRRSTCKCGIREVLMQYNLHYILGFSIGSTQSELFPRIQRKKNTLSSFNIFLFIIFSDWKWRVFDPTTSVGGGIGLFFFFQIQHYVISDGR